MNYHQIISKFRRPTDVERELFNIKDRYRHDEIGNFHAEIYTTTIPHHKKNRDPQEFICFIVRNRIRFILINDDCNSIHFDIKSNRSRCVLHDKAFEIIRNIKTVKDFVYYYYTK